eukprot:1742152-Prymnesium_polylepis.1
MATHNRTPKIHFEKKKHGHALYSTSSDTRPRTQESIPCVHRAPIQQAARPFQTGVCSLTQTAHAGASLTPPLHCTRRRRPPRPPRARLARHALRPSPLPWLGTTASRARCSWICAVYAARSSGA